MNTIQDIIDNDVYTSQIKDQAFFVFREHTLRSTIQFYQQYFKPKIVYALKANNGSHILSVLQQENVTAFDAASIDEIKLIYEYNPTAEIFFMHTVKSRYAIRRAYFNYKVKHYALDSLEELDKILTETDHAKDLVLHLRCRVKNAHSAIVLDHKFGSDDIEAITLLKKIADVTQDIGICFHVGSQCMHPIAYQQAIEKSIRLIEHAKVTPTYFNIGGGFPALYPEMIPPSIKTYFDTIHNSLKLLKLPHVQLLCEPGRSIVAESTSLIVKVIGRKNNTLYINDGIYGTLFDAGFPAFIFPTRHISQSNTSQPNEHIAFQFYGPTCDGLDHMKGPFYLPANTAEGDYIEIGQLGAYAQVLASAFNGFKAITNPFYISDEPIMSHYTTEKTFKNLS